MMKKIRGLDAKENKFHSGEDFLFIYLLLKKSMK